METGKKLLLAALAEEGIPVRSTDGKLVRLAHKVVIEIEGPSLFKLSEAGHPIAPFNSVSELAGFIRMDWIQRGLD